MMNFKLRPARPVDVPALVGLITELAEFEHLAHLVQATPQALLPHLFGDKPVVEAVVVEAEAEAEAEGASASASAAAAEAEAAGAAGQLVGFALFFTNFSTFLAKPGLYLEDLYVQPACRGAGIGKALLSHLGALAVARGYGRFDWSVLDWNENAIRFYEKMGAVVMPEWRICRVAGDALARLGAPGADRDGSPSEGALRQADARMRLNRTAAQARPGAS